MNLLHDFARVRRGRPCPVCGKGDWCLIARDDPADPSHVLCQRVESPRRWGGAGWLHRFRGGVHAPKRTRTIPLRAPRREFDSLYPALQEALSDDRLHELAQRLGLPSEPLRRLRVGWVDEEHGADLNLKYGSGLWSFPMVDAEGRITGIRLRSRSCKKFSVVGSRAGVFLPSRLDSATKRLFIAEGESDVAALLALGLDALGRPGCTQATLITTMCVRKLRPQEVIIVSDNDKVGRRGAMELARRLSTVCCNVRVFVPPAGDIREWVVGGARVRDVNDALETALQVRLKVVGGAR